MMYNVSIEKFNHSHIEKYAFESGSPLEILHTFDSINWMQQIQWSFQESNQGEFVVFEVLDVLTERKFGGLLMVYSRNEFNFHTHAELFEKIQKVRLFGLYKSEAFPTFENNALPFDQFRECLNLFFQNNDLAVEEILNKTYQHYQNNGIFDK